MASYLGTQTPSASARPRRAVTSDVVLQVNGLSAGYGELAAVREVDLTVHAGEVVALLGPNGAGKSATLLTLAGELPPLGGRVNYLGRTGRDPLHRRVREGLGFVPEERSVFQPLTVGANLRLGPGPSDLALDLFSELRPLLGRRAGLCSGGEQQILALARALAARPRLLLVDELSLGLAPIVVGRLLEALRTAADLAARPGSSRLLLWSSCHKAAAGPLRRSPACSFPSGGLPARRVRIGRTPATAARDARYPREGARRSAVPEDSRSRWSRSCRARSSEEGRARPRPDFFERDKAGPDTVFAHKRLRAAFAVGRKGICRR